MVHWKGLSGCDAIKHLLSPSLQSNFHPIRSCASIYHDVSLILHFFTDLDEPRHANETLLHGQGSQPNNSFFGCLKSDIWAMCPNHLGLNWVSKLPILLAIPNWPASSAIVRCSFHWTFLLTPKIQQIHCRWNQSSLLISSWVGAQVSVPYNNTPNYG